MLRVDGDDWAVVALAGGFGGNSLILCPDRPRNRSQRRRVVAAARRRTPPVDPFWTEEPTNYRPQNWIVAALYQRHCLARGWEVPL